MPGWLPGSLGGLRDTRAVLGGPGGSRGVAGKSPGDPWMVFGREADGLPTDVLQANQHRTYKVPINANVRSLNLGNCCAVVLYEVLRRRGLPPG